VDHRSRASFAAERDPPEALAATNEPAVFSWLHCAEIAPKE
jgi:hypothetical protein